MLITLCNRCLKDMALTNTVKRADKSQIKDKCCICNVRYGFDYEVNDMQSIKHPCRAFMCPKVAIDKRGYCDSHMHIYEEREAERKNKVVKPFQYLYNNTRWRKYSDEFIRKHPICNECNKAPSQVVDHIKPHKGDVNLFWDKNNHQALCARCHNRKTAKEDGGFNNAKR